MFAFVTHVAQFRERFGQHDKDILERGVVLIVVVFFLVQTLVRCTCKRHQRQTSLSYELLNQDDGYG